MFSFVNVGFFAHFDECDIISHIINTDVNNTGVV